MDLEDPPVPDLTEQNRRQFMRRTGAAGVVAALGLPGQASAAMEDGEFETDPYSLGVASGDPLPDSVILWTRLAPNPLEAGGGMPDESVEVNWEVATDEAMTDVVRTGTATAEPAHAHTIHVDVGGLEPATEYYYRFEGRPLTLADLEFPAARHAAAAVAEDLEGYDEAVVERAGEYALVDLGAGRPTTPFVALLLDFVDPGETSRALVYARLESHVEKRDTEASDVDGLFDPE